MTGGIYRAFVEKDYERAFALQRTLAKLSSLYAVESPFFGVVKEGIKATGLNISTETIAPVQRLSADKVEQVKQILRSAGIEVKQEIK